MARDDRRIKIHIFPNNSPWGVVKHPTRGNVYKHVVNFPDKSKRAEFVNRYLGSNYETELQNEEYVPFQPIDELRFRFKIVPSSRYSLHKLLNSDYAVVLDSDNNTKFYTLQVESSTVTKVIFLAELDVFFTYNVDDLMFNDGLNYIEQAHEIRYKKDLNGNYDKALVDWNKILRNSFEIQPKRNISFLRVLHEFPITNWIGANISVDMWSETLRAKAQKEVNQLKWALIYFKRTEKSLVDLYEALGGSKPPQIYTRSSGVPEPYIIFAVPFNAQNYLNLHSVNYTYLAADALWSFLRMTNYIINIQVVDHFAIGFDPIFRARLNDRLEIDYSVTFNHFIDTGVRIADFGRYREILYINEVTKLRENEELVTLTNPYSTSDDPIVYHPNLFQIVMKKWESLGRAYSLPRIAFTSALFQHFYFKVKSLYFYSPTENSQLFIIPNNSNYQANDYINNNYLTLNNDDTLNSSESQFSNFIRDNKNTFNQRLIYDRLQGRMGIANSFVQFAGGALGGALAGGMKGGPFGAIAGGVAGFVAGGFNVANSTISHSRNMDLKAAQIADIKNQLPDLNIGNSYNANRFFIKNDNLADLLLLLMVPEKHELDQIRDIVRTYGYSIKQNKQIKQYINSRKHFNYIQAIDVFNNIKLPLSSRIKQIISDAFTEGVTIWHYRSLSQWKGILTFDEPNDEV